MGQGPPELLEDLLELGLGVAWPKSDEDRLEQAKQAWNQAAKDFDGVITDLRAAGGKAHEALQGAPQEAFDAAWAPYVGGDGQAGLLSDLHEALSGLGTTCDNMSTEVSTAKTEFAADVAIQGVAILAQFAAGFFDFGVSDATGTAELVGLRGTLVEILRVLEGKIGAFLTRVLVDAAFGAVFSFVQDAVNQAIEIGYGERTGFDWGEAGTQAGLGAATGAGGALLRGGVGRVAGFDPTSLQGFTGVGFRALTDGAAANAVYDSYAAANGQSVDPMTVLSQFTSAGTQTALGDHANDLGDRIATRLGRRPPNVPDLTGIQPGGESVGDLTKAPTADSGTSAPVAPHGETGDGSAPVRPDDAIAPVDKAVEPGDAAAPVLTAGLGHQAEPSLPAHTVEHAPADITGDGAAPSRFAWITRKTTPDAAPIPDHAPEPTLLAHEGVGATETPRPSAHVETTNPVSPGNRQPDHAGATPAERPPRTEPDRAPTHIDGASPAIVDSDPKHAAPATGSRPPRVREETPGPAEIPAASAPSGGVHPDRAGDAAPPGHDRAPKSGPPEPTAGGHRDVAAAPVADGPSDPFAGTTPGPGHPAQGTTAGPPSAAHHTDAVVGQHPPDVGVVPVLVGPDGMVLPEPAPGHAFGEAPESSRYDVLASAPPSAAPQQHPTSASRPAPVGYGYYQRPGWHRARDAAPVFTKSDVTVEQREVITQPNQTTPGTPMVAPNGDPLGYHVKAGYDVRRFHFDGDTYTELTVKLHLNPDIGVPADSIPALKDAARKGIDDFYNGPGHRLGDGARLHVRVEFVDDPAAAHSQIQVKRNVYTFDQSGKRILNVFKMRADQVTWYSSTVGVVAAHEVGHHLGLLDEYVDLVNPQHPHAIVQGRPVWYRSIARATANSPGVRQGPGLMGDALLFDAKKGLVSAKQGTSLTVENIGQLSNDVAALLTWTPPPAPLPSAPPPSVSGVSVNQSGTGNHGPPRSAGVH